MAGRLGTRRLPIGRGSYRVENLKPDLRVDRGVDPLTDGEVGGHFAHQNDGYGAADENHPKNGRPTEQATHQGGKSGGSVTRADFAQLAPLTASSGDPSEHLEFAEPSKQAR